MPHIHTPGPTVILSATGKSSAYATGGSTVLVGDWYKVHPSLGRPYFTCKLTGTSAGSTATATVSIQGSNDGTNAPSTDIYTFSGITLTTNTVVLGGTPASTAGGGGHPAYIRANLTSLTTSTAGSTAAQSANVVVIASYGYTGQG